MAKKPPQQQEVITIPYRYIPRSYQASLLQAMDSGKRFAFLRWSRRAGKDKTCFNLMAKRMFQEVGVYYYLFPTFAQGRKALWETIQGEGKDAMKIIDHIPKQFIKSINNNEMKFELINGSVFRVVGTDNFDNLMGTNPKGLIFSEYQAHDPRAWEYLQPIVMQNGGWVVFNGTPRGKNHFYDLEQVALKNQHSWYCSVVQSLSPDLPHYYPIRNDSEADTMKMIEEVRASGTTEDRIASEYGVSYTAAAEGTYYADLIEKARKEGRIGHYPKNDSLWVDTFWDIGKNDSTVIWFRQQSGDRLTFIDVLEDTGKTPADYVYMLQEKGYKYRTHYLPHDAKHDTFTGCAANLLRTSMQSAGISDDIVIAEKPRNKLDAINQVRARFSRYYFNEDLCLDAIVKLSLYHKKYDQHRRVFLDLPVHDWTSHTADALTTEALTSGINEQDGFFAQAKAKLITDFNPLSDFDND